MRHRDEIPVEVAIDEAVNLAQEFCGADAPDFVNGTSARRRADDRSLVTAFLEITKRLNEIAEELRGRVRHWTSAPRELAREAAELVGQAGNEIERVLRAEPGGDG